MDPRRNPYAPGAGTPPPELAGRDALVDAAAVALDRIRDGKPEQSFIFNGLRGVGKTVLINKVQKDAEARSFSCVWMEAPEDRSLPALLAPALRAALISLSHIAKAKAKAMSALKALMGFARGMKVKFGDIEMSLDYKSEKGVADSGDLENDLTALISRAGDAAADAETAMVLFIDELQYVKEEQLASLITALHRANQNRLPITMVAAGLPQLIGQMGRAKSYAERLFSFVPVGSLDEKAARAALIVPAEREKVSFAEPAIESILRQTQGYPYFLQEWGKHSWNIAKSSPILKDDAEKATTSALAHLDESFFRVRFDRLTPMERRYMRAMAELGPGPHRSGEIADLLGREVTEVAPMRNKIISKGMIYSPSHGDTAFTVPLFDGYLKRIMPTFS